MKFKISNRKRSKIEAYKYFEPDAEPPKNLTYDDYVILRRTIEKEPIVGYLIQKLGMKPIKL